MPIRHLQPQAVWQWFADICAIPHPTYQEAELAAMIVRRAAGRGLGVRQDDKGNIYLSKPASGSGMADKDGVILQAHIDMVAQKTPDSDHDFARDPIRPRIENGWVCADRTTLGADNGIGAALALAVAFADDIPHPLLEVLLTVEEETGMGGVRAVRGDWLRGRYLLNLDSEESGSIYLGCAGGRDAELTLPLAQEAAPGAPCWQIDVAGLPGGHSGIDIHRGRGNAVKLLADLLGRLPDSLNWQLAGFQGGRLRNVIPREASARIILPEPETARLHALLALAEQEARRELGGHAAHLTIRAAAAEPAAAAFSAADSRCITDLLTALPDGVIRWSDDFSGVVETSVCLSTVQTDARGLHACLLMRSLLETPKDALCRHLGALARLSGATLSTGGDYPGWTPDPSSALFAAARQVFAEHSGKPPTAGVMHAGLECGLMQHRLPDVQMISFGPTIEGAHTPRERVNIDAVAECWTLLRALLQNTPTRPQQA